MSPPRLAVLFSVLVQFLSPADPAVWIVAPGTSGDFTDIQSANIPS